MKGVICSSLVVSAITLNSLSDVVEDDAYNY